MKGSIKLSEADWKKKLTLEEFHILREKGTERPFTGKYLDNKQKGKYYCKGCGNELFSSDSKFNSGTGWPSFTEPLVEKNIEEIEDLSYGMVRTEINCSKCGGHLGHVFEDGPKPSGKRYCINSLSLKFQEEK